MAKIRKYRGKKSTKYSCADENMFCTSDIEDIEEGEALYLIMQLLEYAEELCEEIINLRKAVNKLDKQNKKLQKIDMRGYQEPYIILISDIYRSFYEIHGYERFREVFVGTNFE